MRASTEQVAPDGPYVDGGGPEGWRASRIIADGRAASSAVVGGTIRVEAIDGVPAFNVRLRSPPSPASGDEEWGDDAPLFVVADTHGEYSVLVALLQSQGIVDSELRWKFGLGHLAFTGDMLDRGAHQIEILWLLYKLEAEAALVGGRVHVLLGNHETMVLRGDQRYLNPRYLAVANAFGAPTYGALLGPGSVLGAWLRSRPAVLKLGDLLLLHGGVSPELTASPLSPDAVNDTVRRNIDTSHDTTPPEGSDDALVMGPRGPLWYRGYFELGGRPAEATASDIEAAKARFGVRRILVGHTPVDQVKPLFDGSVIAIQVYPHRHRQTGAPVLEGALRINRSWYRATAQGERVPLGIVDWGCASGR